VPLPVNGSSGPVGPVAAVVPPLVLRVVGARRRLGATATGWGASSTVAGPRTAPSVVVVVLVEVVELVEDVVLVELVVDVDVDVVVALGRSPVLGGVVAGGPGAAPAAIAPYQHPRTTTASAAVPTIALRRNGCGSVTGPPWARADAGSAGHGSSSSPVTVTPRPAEVGDLGGAGSG
jgi:hypothetical protein